MTSIRSRKIDCWWLSCLSFGLSLLGTSHEVGAVMHCTITINFLMKSFNNEPEGIKKGRFLSPLDSNSRHLWSNWLADKAENRRDLGKTQESHPICAVLRTKSRDWTREGRMCKNFTWAQGKFFSFLSAPYRLWFFFPSVHFLLKPSSQLF